MVSRIRSMNVLRFSQNPRTSGEFPIFVEHKLCCFLKSVHEPQIINTSVLWGEMICQTKMTYVELDRKVQEKGVWKNSCFINKIWSCIHPYTLHVFKRWCFKQVSCPFLLFLVSPQTINTTICQGKAAPMVWIWCTFIFTIHFHL